MDTEPIPSTKRTVSPAPRPPAGTGTLGLILFLVSLSVLFVASMVAYGIIRVTGTHAPPLHTLRIPSGFWVSTAIILASSIAIQRALRGVRQGTLVGFHIAMVVTMLLGLAFLAVQVPNLYRLYLAHEAAKSSNVFLYGLALMLITLHAAHVVGGVIPLAVATSRALRGRYGQQEHRGVKYVAMYWHFLDVVWVVMFTLFLLTG